MRMVDAFVPPMNYNCKVEDVLFRNVARNCEIVGNVFSFETDIFVILDEKKSRKYAVHFVVKDNAVKNIKLYNNRGRVLALLSDTGLFYEDLEYVVMEYIDEVGVIAENNEYFITNF